MGELLFRELSYKLRGLFFKIRNTYGPGQKENIYRNLLIDALKENKIPFEKEKPINIYSYLEMYSSQDLTGRESRFFSTSAFIKRSAFLRFVNK